MITEIIALQVSHPKIVFIGINDKFSWLFSGLDIVFNIIDNHSTFRMT